MWVCLVCCLCADSAVPCSFSVTARTKFNLHILTISRSPPLRLFTEASFSSWFSLSILLSLDHRKPQPEHFFLQETRLPNCRKAGLIILQEAQWTPIVEFSSLLLSRERKDIFFTCYHTWTTFFRYSNSSFLHFSLWVLIIALLIPSCVQKLLPLVFDLPLALFCFSAFRVDVVICFLGQLDGLWRVYEGMFMYLLFFSGWIWRLEGGHRFTSWVWNRA